MMSALFLIFFGTAGQAEPLCRNCNVIVIAVDALQASHVGHLGYDKNTTPEIDKLAKRGFVFSQAISPSSWTIPTYLSLFTSTYPSVHGLTNRYSKFTPQEKIVLNFKNRSPELITLAQIFKDNGFRTAGFTGDSGVSAVLGYDKGFETYTDETQFGGLANSTGKALTWLDGLAGQKFFLFVHGYDSHGQFQPDDKTRKQAELREKGLRNELPPLSASEIAFWRTWYDQRISRADQQVGKFIVELEKRKMLKNSVVILLSDHGSEYFEHSRVDHGHSLYDELIHVPLVFVLPKNMSEKKFANQVGTINLLPTLLELTGLPTSKVLQKQISGRSLAPAMRLGRWDGEDVFSETDYRGYTHKRAIRSKDGWKYIMTLENGKEELFNLNKDPKEQQDLAKLETGKLRNLKEKLLAHLARLPVSKSTSGSQCLPVYSGQCE